MALGDNSQLRFGFALLGCPSFNLSFRPAPLCPPFDCQEAPATLYMRGIKVVCFTWLAAATPFLALLS